jgi:hypothetical protein
MSDRIDIDRALEAWRSATEDARAPAGFAESVLRQVEAGPPEGPSLADAIWLLARPAFFASAVVAVTLAGVALGAARGLAHDAADYAIVRGP